MSGQIVIVWPFTGCWRLAGSLHGPHSAMQMLFLPFLSTWMLHMGLFTFVLRLGMLLYLMGWCLGDEGDNLKGWCLGLHW